MTTRPFCREALEKSGARTVSDFVFFFGHSAKAGELACLSNWYVLPEPFQDESGNKFPTSEHYMMHRKAILLGDTEMARAILDTASPGEAKKLGRRVRNFDQDVWRRECVDIVARGCVLKFSQCAHARDVLLATDDKIIVETATRDRLWGIGMGKNNPARLDPSTWRGLNLLGEALMIARQRIKEMKIESESEGGVNLE